MLHGLMSRIVTPAEHRVDRLASLVVGIEPNSLQEGAPGAHTVEEKVLLQFVQQARRAGMLSSLRKAPIRQHALTERVHGAHVHAGEIKGATGAVGDDPQQSL